MHENWWKYMDQPEEASPSDGLLGERWIDCPDSQGWWWHFYEGAAVPYPYGIILSKTGPDRYFIQYPDTIGAGWPANAAWADARSRLSQHRASFDVQAWMEHPRPYRVPAPPEPKAAGYEPLHDDASPVGCKAGNAVAPGLIMEKGETTDGD
jgi:hypothetical protein